MKHPGFIIIDEAGEVFYARDIDAGDLSAASDGIIEIINLNLMKFHEEGGFTGDLRQWDDLKSNSDN